jgi:cAMP-dependent protein kinase regulator
MTTAKELFEEADRAFKRGKWTEALAGFGGVVEVCPDHLKSRFRVADCLLNLGRRELALETYKGIAWHAIKDGHPLLGLVASKMVLLLEPAFEDVLFILAELYSSQSDRVDRDMPPKDYEPLSDDEATPLSGDIVEAAAQAASHFAVVDYPKKLPRIPLFSYLDEDSFVHVLTKLKLRRYADEEAVIRQGERGDSFFMIADGDVAVTRDVEDEGGVTLAQLHSGAVFGEKALVSDDPRHASVIASGDVDVLEMKRSDLVVASASVEGVTKALKAFTRERFLGNLTATHTFFNALSKAERHRVIRDFVPVAFDPGQDMIVEGQKGEGLFLILGGAAQVTKFSGEDRIHLATLKASDLCGEMSLIGDQKTSATVTAEDRVEALFLSRQSFNGIVGKHPELMKYIAGLTADRLSHNRQLLHGHGLLEDDEHVMI